MIQKDVEMWHPVAGQWGLVDARTDYEYDSAGRQAQVIGPAVWVYDPATQSYSQTRPATRFVYDPLGRLLSTVYDDGTFTSNVYDDRGRRVAEIDANGQRTDYEYDDAGRLTAVVQPAVYDTDTEQFVRPRYEYEYDLYGNLTVQRDALGRQTLFGYDHAGRSTQRTLPDVPGEPTATETTRYDNFGRRGHHVDFHGNQTVWIYDALGRIDEERWFAPGINIETGTPGIVIAYGYDALGRVEQVTHTEGAKVRVTHYGYDREGRLTSVDSPEGLIQYEYDPATGLHVRTWTGDSAVEYGYDALGRLKTVLATMQNGTSASELTSYGYDAAGNLAWVLLPNGVVTTYTYDGRNRLDRMESRDGLDNLISRYDYAVNAAGHRTQVVENHGGNVRTVNYTYDSLHRLIAEEILDGVNGNRTAVYTFDLVGNRLSKDDSADGLTTYLYDQRDRLTTRTRGTEVTTYWYDANGSTIEERLDGASVATYEWDERKRMTGATVNGVWAEYEYDHRHHRVAVTRGGQATRYLVDANNPTGWSQVLEEQDGAGDLLVSYVIGHDQISQNRGGTVHYYVYDGLGSVRALTDASGVVSDRYRYDAYGVDLGSTGSTENSYRFAGERLDGVTGMLHLRDRDLVLSNGRMLRADDYQGRIGEPMTLHRYLYAHANPVMYTDPTGHWTLVEKLGVTAGVQSLIALLANYTITGIAGYNVGRDPNLLPDALVFNLGWAYGSRGLVGGFVVTGVIPFNGSGLYLLGTAEGGIAPITNFRNHRGGAWLFTVGAAWNMKSVSDFSGWGVTASWPRAFAGVAVPPPFNKSRLQDVVLTLARHAKGTNMMNRRPGVIQVTQSSSGAVAVTGGFWAYSFSTTVSWSTKPIAIVDLPDAVASVVRRIYQAAAGLSSTSSVSSFTSVLYPIADYIEDLSEDW